MISLTKKIGSTAVIWCIWHTIQARNAPGVLPFVQKKTRGPRRELVTGKAQRFWWKMRVMRDLYYIQAAMTVAGIVTVG